MKKLNVLIALATLLLFFACSDDNELKVQEESILPETFSIDIPTSISQDASVATAGRTAVDTLQGNDIYLHLTTFIRVGENSADIVEAIIRSIRRHQINRPMALTVRGDEDDRDKNILVEENVFFEGLTWDYLLTISDADSENNEDRGIALQLFWNRAPRKGIAIMKPYNWDRLRNEYMEQAMYRVEYSEGGENGYEAHMIVSISGLPLENPLDNPYSMSTLKMFVGKKGDIIDVYGNSDHPNAKFFNSESGFNWAFVAAGMHKRKLGVAEVGLPPSFLDETSSQVLLKQYAIRAVFEAQIYETWPAIDPETVDAYLYNTAAPGYFADKGFLSGGKSPGPQYDEVEARLSQLSPYNPKEVTNLKLEFFK